MSLMIRRHRAVAECLNEIRGLRDTIGPSDALIEAVRPVLVELGSKGDLFPQHTFRVVDGKAAIYELSADPDGRLGLYASAGLPGKKQPPHDHRTWSCIAGVRGAEWNRYFDRVDDGSEPGRGVLEPTGDKVIRAGSARGMMGHKFHTIEVIEEDPALHLHLYGHTLDRLVGRVYFESEAGGDVKLFMTQPDLRTALVTPAELKEMFDDGDEIAVVDTRELGEWVRGHILRSSPLPRSRLELDARSLIPRRDVRVIVIGSDDVRAHEAAHQLRRGGYLNLAVLEGGIQACREAGMSVHEGMGTFEKAFGELVITELGTPKISVDELEAMRDVGTEHALVDCRPRPEFEALRVPGAHSAPGVSLLAGIEQLGLDETTPVVVSCAGRTRSIIGAQTLIDVGLTNPVMSLENGAMGWRLAGGELASGPDDELRLTPSPSARRRAADRARRLAAERGIRIVGEDVVATCRSDTTRTTYFFDVRSPEAYDAGHRAGFTSVAGGQLLQELTQRVAVHGARMVLMDEDQTEAIITAAWLARMGFEVSVLADGLMGQYLVTSDAPDLLTEPDTTEAVSWHAIEGETSAGAVVIDCSSSRRYREGHIPGSLHCVRSELVAGLERVDAQRLLFVSERGEVARFAAADAARLGRSAAHVIGGISAWVEAGQELTADSGSYLVEPNDIWAKPYESSTDATGPMQAYLDWEVALLASVDLSELTDLGVQRV
jgi:rhodanese-related sulfurtransferase/predicted metal-dependent enzyme (double-stranded beta helix superfamily)